MSQYLASAAIIAAYRHPTHCISQPPLSAHHPHHLYIYKIYPDFLHSCLLNCLTLEMSVSIYTTTHPNALEELNFKYQSAIEPEHVEAEYASCSVSVCAV
jgi:hypothetical protein